MLFQRSRFRSTLVLLALASALLARAQSAGGVYQGTLGNQQIVAVRFMAVIFIVAMALISRLPARG
jgi:hypothetical protein